MPTPARVDPPGLRPTAWIRPAALTAAAILCATTGCDGPGAPPRPTTVKVTPPTAEMTALESKVRFRAEVLDQYGNVVDFPRAVWSSGDTVVATVDSSGLATAVANGSVEIVAKAGEASGSATAMVKQLVRRVVVSPATDTIAIGDTLRLVAEGMDANGHAAEEAEFSWSSENDAVATVDASGRVRGRAHGAATITAVADGSEGSAEITVWHPDRWALTSLYDATDGPNWVSSENWLTDRPLGEWHGVRTDGSGGVVQLDLNDNGLTGRIPPELGDLENLEGLYLTNNGLTGQIPPELGDLAKLEHLYLGATELTGKIPPELGGLVNLTVLYLAWAGLTGGIPPELGDLAKLRELSLFGNGLTGGIPPELGGLANLESLYLFDNGLTGGIPSELGGLANLRILSLYNNGLTGGIPAELGDLIDLRTLSLAGNDLSGPVPPEFGQLANLGRLELASNSRMSGALPSILTDLPLDTLQAGGTGLCAPRTAAFADWLGAMSRSWIGRCGATMAYLVQAVQSRTHPVPLVAGEKALLRVFVTAAKETEEGVPPVRARFFADGDETYRVDIPAKSTPIPTEVDEGDLSKSANVEIPGRIVEPGLEMVIEIDPDGTLDDDLGVPKRIPEEDRMAVEVRTMPVLDLTAIPFLWTEDPDSAILDAVDDMEDDPEGHDLLENTRILLPVGGIAVTAHEAVASSSNNAFDLLEETEAIRVLEGGGGHYMGTMSGPVTGPVGVAWAPGRSSFSVPAADVIAHELGHNLSLGHAPCGGAGGPDPSFPDPKGRIGAWGYDFRTEGLVRANVPDLMSYCRPHWVGGYHFTSALRHRLADEGEPGAPEPSLLLWGGVDPDGDPFLNPAFVADAAATLPDSAGAYTVTGRDAGGGVLFSLSFAMPVVLSERETGSAFVFALPVRPGWAGALAAIALSGPDDRTATLDADSDRPMAILIDRRTRQVRAVLRNVPAPPAVGDGMEVLFSRGIPEAGEWRR